MTRRFRPTGLIFLSAVAGVAASAGNSAMTPSTVSANAHGMTGMRGTPAHVEHVSAVTLKHQRVVRLSVQSMTFKPARVVVSVGTKLVWTNRDGFQHTVTSDRGLWDSGPMDTGATFTRVFKRVGTFPYHCSIHPFMRGTVTVTR